MLRVIFGLTFGLLFVLGTTPLISAISLYDSVNHDDLIVVLETNAGDIVIDFFYEDAPNHTENFLKLADEGFYDGIFFHRIIPDFMIQTGDPKTKKTCDILTGPDAGCPNIHSDYPASEWGTGGPEHRIPAEFNDIMHQRGIVSMARSQDPNSAGSQFFIVHQDSTFLDTQYTVFGRIVTEESFRTLDRIAGIELVGENPENPEQVRINSAEFLSRKMIEKTGTYIELDVDSIRGDYNIEPKTTPTLVPGAKQESVISSQRLGIQFNAPLGWSFQEPPKTNETSPDIVLLAPTSEKGVPDSLTLTVRDSNGMTFEQFQVDKFNKLQPRIDDGSLVLKYTGASSVNGRDVYSIYAQGAFLKDEERISILFAEVSIYDKDKIYTFSTSSANFAMFDKQVEKVENAVYSFKKLGNFAVKETPPVDEEGGGCLIATAAYGSEMAPQVQFLRELRDNTVLQTQSGTAFMTGFNQFYYSFSPYVADYERENPVFKEAVKVTLTPMLTSLTLLNYVDVDTEEEMFGYGISLILLNIGMYFVAPAAAIVAIKNRLRQQ